MAGCTIISGFGAITIPLSIIEMKIHLVPTFLALTVHFVIKCWNMRISCSIAESTRGIDNTQTDSSTLEVPKYLQVQLADLEYCGHSVPCICTPTPAVYFFTFSLSNLFVISCYLWSAACRNAFGFIMFGESSSP